MYVGGTLNFAAAAAAACHYSEQQAYPAASNGVGASNGPAPARWMQAARRCFFSLFQSAQRGAACARSSESRSPHAAGLVSTGLAVCVCVCVCTYKYTARPRPAPVRPREPTAAGHHHRLGGHALHVPGACTYSRMHVGRPVQLHASHNTLLGRSLASPGLACVVPNR